MMNLTYLVLQLSEDDRSGLKLQNELNNRAGEGYRLAGIVPERTGVRPTIVILEKQQGPAAAVVRQQPPRA